jgi:hypothetical protein
MTQARIRVYEESLGFGEIPAQSQERSKVLV